MDREEHRAALERHLSGRLARLWLHPAVWTSPRRGAAYTRSCVSSCLTSALNGGSRTDAPEVPVMQQAPLFEPPRAPAHTQRVPSRLTSQYQWPSSSLGMMMRNS